MRSKLRHPLVSYFGGKWRLGSRYPAPTSSTIVEPFAGGASYSLRYADLQVELYDLNEDVCAMWDFVINASEHDISAIPDVADTDDLPGWVSGGARVLVGFQMARSLVVPRRMVTSWVKRDGGGWNEKTKRRVISINRSISHWKVFNMTYESIDVAREATWFVDPPYQRQGNKYPHGAAEIDFARLGRWCHELRGQSIVCESGGADWLPFRDLYNSQNASQGGRGRTQEVVWLGSASR